MSKILVTGGTGFIGSNLARALLEKGHSLRVLDNLSTGRAENLADIEDRIEMINGDITDSETVSRAMKNVNYVFHEAAFVSVPRSMKNPLRAAEVNVKGTLNVLVSAKESGVKRVVFASSSSVYGDLPTLPKSEGMEPNPISPYALSKLLAEQWCQLFTKTYGLETVILRYFNVFGPMQDPNSEYAAVIPKFIGALLEGRPPVIFGDGKQSRDFTYVQDVVNANLLALEGEPGTYNIGSGNQITIKEMADLLAKIANKNIKPEYADPRSGDILHSLADISKAREGLGYEPKYTLEQGLKETVRWFNERS